MVRLIIIIFLLLVCKLVYADIVVIYNTQSKEVASIQNDDSAVLQDGFTKKIITGKKIADYGLDQNAMDYKFINNNFVVNSKKISDRENAKITAQEASIEQKMIDDKIKDEAIDKLRAEGKSFKHIKKSGE